VASDQTQELTPESAIVYSGKLLDGGVMPHRAGRPKGVPNKTTQEVKAAARAIVDDPAYRESLIKRLHAGLAPHMEPLLWHYAYGKPKETIEVEGTVTVEKIVREVIKPQVIDIDAIH
jgi:hypothetical protein